MTQVKAPKFADRQPIVGKTPTSAVERAPTPEIVRLRLPEPESEG